jgi:hypothetical protein
MPVVLTRPNRMARFHAFLAGKHPPEDCSSLPPFRFFLFGMAEDHPWRMPPEPVRFPGSRRHFIDCSQ